MKAKLKVGIWGASGYVGAELIRLCLAHPHLELVHLGARRQVGERVDAHFPALHGHVDACFEPIDPARARACDVLFSCLPHAASHEALAPLVGAVKLIDLSGDFRLHDPLAYERAYGGVHPHPGLLDRFVYGLPELNRATIRGADAIANPGCFATACTLALLPLAKEGWLGGDVHLAAVTGSSGSGASPVDGTHHPSRSQDFYAYKALAHQHEPEIAQTLADAGGSGFALHLVPHSAPLARGIHVTAFVTLAPDLDVAGAYGRHYGPEPFVRMHGEPHLLRVRGQNHCDVAWTRRGDTLVVTAAIDNLCKGASGQALQNLNLMAGFDETTGLLALPMVV